MKIKQTAAGLFVAGFAAGAACAQLSPLAITVSRDGKTLFVAEATARQVVFFDLAARKVRATVAVPDQPTGQALSADGARLYVTCAAPASKVAIIDTAKARVLETLRAGHTAGGPELSPDGKTLFVCNRFDGDVSFLDLATKKEMGRVKVLREPVSAAITRDGKYLLVANHLHDGRADADVVAAAVSVIDVAARKVARNIGLPNGSGALEEIRISPDGKYAVVTHVIARYQMPTTQLDRGWMHTNAISLIDLGKLELVNSVLLDGVAHGAANPWGLDWTADGKTLVVAHSGIHELSLIDFPALLARLARLPAKADVKEAVMVSTSRVQADVPNDLAFLLGVRELVALPKSDRGPRGVAIAGTRAYTANYYSDTLSVVDLAAPVRRADSLPLGEKRAMSRVRKGEFYFHDANLCFQGWQSCASCHPNEARTDALNWDLLNDGLGNPKNSKSMLYAHRTPPAMSMGERDTAETAVRAGITNILFTEQPEEVPLAIDEYLKSLRPAPSPYLVNAQLSQSALRGRALFNDVTVGCAKCHPAKSLYTDMKPHDVGTTGRFDKGNEEFDTPTLIENWRTAPYLHDGSAATMLDVLTGRNPQDKHGKTKPLTKGQLADLAAYVLSL